MRLSQTQANQAKRLAGLMLLILPVVMSSQSARAQSFQGNTPSLEYCRQYRESAGANAQSSSIRGSASGWGSVGAGGGSVSGQSDRSQSSSQLARFERNCDQLLRSAGEVTIEQIRATTERQSIKQNATTNRYTACLQAAQYSNASRRQDHLAGCQCLAQGLTPKFSFYGGYFEKCAAE
jgi:hypothetical protein